MEIAKYCDSDRTTELLKIRDNFRNKLSRESRDFGAYNMEVSVKSFKNRQLQISFQPYLSGKFKEYIYKTYNADDLPSSNILNSIVKDKYPEYFI